MSIVLLVYLASVVDSLKFVSGFLAIALSLFLIGYFVGVAIYNSEPSYTQKDKATVKHPRKIIFAILLSLTLTVFTPSEKAVYIIAGASIAQDIANSPKTAATLDKVYKIVDKKLDEQLSEGINKATKKMEEASK
jgi:hypothetical protein